jgi:iron complex transport system permease protein
MTARSRTVLGLTALLLVIVAAWSVTVGAAGVSIRHLLEVLGDMVGLRMSDDIPQSAVTVIRDIRLPRIILSMAVGAALGLCGGALQGVFANPLADPGLIGTSSGAALGAVVAIFLGISTVGSWSTPLFAFLGALGVTALVYRIARHDGRTQVVTLILTGIAINAMVVAAIGYITYLADDQQLRSIVFWQLGSMAAATWTTVAVAWSFLAVGVMVLPRVARSLDLLALGEREARHLGVHTERLRITVMGTSALVVGASVAVAGIIAFVGLVVPHLIRLLAGPSHRSLLPGSALGGALLLVAADVIARTSVSPAELPLGVLTSAVGGVFFIWLLMTVRGDQGGWG